METVLTVFVLAVAAAVSWKVIHNVSARRSAERRAEFEGSGTTAFPCRMSWKTGMGRSGFVYGKLHVGDGGALTFRRRLRADLRIPGGKEIRQRDSWRTGLVVLTYTAPAGDHIEILLGHGDAEAVITALEAG